MHQFRSYCQNNATRIGRQILDFGTYTYKWFVVESWGHRQSTHVWLIFVHVTLVRVVLSCQTSVEPICFTDTNTPLITWLKVLTESEYSYQYWYQYILYY